jgi:hypothetical protein
MDVLRRRAGKPDLPIWFVFFDKRKGADAGQKAAQQSAALARQYSGMHVSYSPGGEYTHSVDATA